MDISIGFLSDDPKIIWEMPALEGEIIIGNFREFFVSSLLGPWNIDDYKRQWEEGFERIKKHNESCLVASVQQASVNPEILGLVHWWVMYKQDGRIYVQNMFFCERVYDMYIGKGSFTPDDCYQYIPTRRTHMTNGMEVSEWYIDLKDIS